MRLKCIFVLPYKFGKYKKITLSSSEHERVFIYKKIHYRIDSFSRLMIFIDVSWQTNNADTQLFYEERSNFTGNSMNIHPLSSYT